MSALKHLNQQRDATDKKIAKYGLIILSVFFTVGVALGIAIYATVNSFTIMKSLFVFGSLALSTLAFVLAVIYYKKKSEKETC